MKPNVLNSYQPGSLKARAFNSFLTCALFAAGMLLAAGCAMSDDRVISVSMNKDFRLRVGESALVSPDKLQIGILGVTKDSRCGKGEVCFQEGDAVVHIWLRIANMAKQEHELHTGSRKPGTVDYAGHRVVLVSLNPAPVSGRRIAPEEYIATLRVVDGNRKDP